MKRISIDGFVYITDDNNQLVSKVPTSKKEKEYNKFKRNLKLKRNLKKPK